MLADVTIAWLAAGRDFALPCGVPYRIDVSDPPADAVDVLVELGALDIEPVGGALAAILPDDVRPEAVASTLGAARITVSEATARDDGSVWLLTPRALRIGGIVVAPPGAAAPGNALRLTDSRAFGTGHHPTTALCIEAIEETLSKERPNRILDVGTGSGILALVALKLGVPQAVALDVDTEALKAAAENARLNRLADRLQLVPGGPAVLNGTWPLVVANVLAAPLIDMAPMLVRRVASRGRVILSGIPRSLEAEVGHPYQHLGMRHVGSRTRAGWTMIVLQASW
jgi:ribosomal protein L11 methyltransferase